MEAIAASSEAAGAIAARVLLVAPPAEGGLAGHVVALLAGLHRDGHQVGTACQPDSPIARAAADRSAPVYAMTCTAAGGPTRIMARALRLAQAIGEFRPHIVHAHSFGASTIAAIACAVARPARLLITIHNYPPGATAFTPSSAGYRWALGIAVHRSRRIIAVSEALRRDLVAAHPEIEGKCLTIPNGVEITAPLRRCPADVRADLGLSADQPLVGMVARFAPQKGIREFIRAARLVADAFPDCAFVLAGDGPLREEAERLRDGLALSERLFLLGRIDWARDLIGALDLLVVSSLSEGSSIVAMEAMALGRPVVASAVGGVPEVIADGEVGILVEPGAPEALAGAIGELLRDPVRAGEMGECGRQRAAARFDIEDMFAHTKAVYADLMRETAEVGGG